MGYHGDKVYAEMTFDINFIILIYNQWNNSTPLPICFILRQLRNTHTAEQLRIIVY